MDNMDEDYHYAKGRSPGRLYTSKRFTIPKGDRFQRYGHRVLADEGFTEVLREGNEIVLRETLTGKQQVKAKFF